MKGRDLIIYILKNELEDKDIMSEEFLSFLPTVEAVAQMFDVGTHTVLTWAIVGDLELMTINGKAYINPDSLDRFAERMARKEVENA